MRSKLALTAICFLPWVSTLSAEDKCQEFRAMSQQTLTSKGYMGPTYAMLGTEVLIDDGKTDPLPQPSGATLKCQGAICQDRKTQYRFIFGTDDSFIVEVDVAVYDLPPFDPTAPPMMGIYRSTEKIISGTGRFERATGNLVEAGPFIAWNDANGVQARYSGVTTGKICGVAPKQ